MKSNEWGKKEGLEENGRVFRKDENEGMERGDVWRRDVKANCKEVQGFLFGW